MIDYVEMHNNYINIIRYMSQSNVCKSLLL